jgi:type IV pilus assembly protein PilO
MANFNFDLNELELEDFGNWPLPVKAILVVILAIAVFMLGFWVDTKRAIAVLNDSIKIEVNLKSEFEQKQHRAMNLVAYREQLKKMKDSFGTLLKQLPEKTEVPALVEDISQQGLAVGLEFKSIRLLPEKTVDFYVELPIELTLVGNYHQLAEFVSNVASLPRIVTLHNFSIVPLETIKDGSQLQMTMTAKTYRYTSEAHEVKSS